jgi:hypothetical protein
MRTVALVTGLALAVGAATGLAQRRGGFGGPRQGSPILPNIPYDGKFTFVRLRYGPPVSYASQRVMWSHDYPTGERNFMRIMDELTFLAPHTDETNILSLDDPELFNYPVAYLCEPGYQWTVDDQEAAQLRAYLLKGGFLIVDDFRGRDWPAFEEQMRRVLPDVQFFDLDAGNPIFHSFFDIDAPTEYPNFYDPGKPIFRGIYEHNDPARRLMAMINYNTDISEFWEFSATGLRPIDESNDAYKLGVNYLMYAMTH